MKRRISITLLFCLLITFLFVGCGESSGNNETDWRNEEIVDFVFDPNNFEDDYGNVTFFDDFNGNTLDPTKWDKCPEWERQAHLDNHGWWEDDCSWVENGNLVLEGKKDGNKLLSGAIRTKSKDFSKVFFEQAEGLFEFKFKAEYASGLWYAVWLMCPEEQENIGNGATDGAEIDMIEILPNDNRRTYYQSAVHWDGYGSQHGSNHKGKDISKDFYDDWHVAQFVWHKHGYQLYMDGELAYDMKGREFGGTSKVPTYLKITSEFGSWGGPLDKDFESAKFYVDYIKVYERTSPYPYDVEEEPETPEPDNEGSEEAPVKKTLTGFMTGDNIWSSGTNITESEGVYTATSGTGWDKDGSCSLPVQFAAGTLVGVTKVQATFDLTNFDVRAGSAQYPSYEFKLEWANKGAGIAEGTLDGNVVTWNLTETQLANLETAHQAMITIRGTGTLKMSDVVMF